MVSISIRSVDFAFTAGKGIFQNLSLELGNGPVLILGPSGCGKTTLLRLIAGLLEPQAGELFVHGESNPGAGSAVSMVFQEPRLLPWKTALENVSLPLAERLGKKEAQAQARRFLRLVSLEDKAESLPAELSGGQKQRVNLARAFAFPGEILLMDEPFQSLDIPLRIELMDLTLSLLADFPRLVVMVSHDPREAVYMGKRIIVLGKSPRGIIHDEILHLDRPRYGSSAELEQRLLSLLYPLKNA
ncbi:ABC transporter ATPase [Spirochaetia bacterium]|nr:ABC transporter ATPase [Spirochaetia bacterium]